MSLSEHARANAPNTGPIDAGNVVVMQGHYVAKGKTTGKSVRAAVSHVLEISDGKIVRFDQYVDSATINPTIGA